MAPMAPALLAGVFVLWIAILENLGGDFTDVVTGGFSYETAVAYFLIYFTNVYVPVAAFIAICHLPFVFFRKNLLQPQPTLPPRPRNSFRKDRRVDASAF